LQLKPGDIITAIDGEQLKDGTNLSKLLNAKVGENVEVMVQPAPGADTASKPPAASAAKSSPTPAAKPPETSAAKPATTVTTSKPKKIELQAVSRDKMRELMYDRWVDHNTRRVAELSHGKLGYIHIPSMDEAGLDRFIRALYSENFDKEALVL